MGRRPNGRGWFGTVLILGLACSFLAGCGPGADRTAGPPAADRPAETRKRPGVRVRVVDPDGKPVPGVPVKLVAFDERSASSNGRPVPTGPDGVATLDVKPRDFVVTMKYRVEAVVPALAASTADLDPEQAFEGPIDVAIPHFGHIVVDVTDEGRPVPDGVFVVDVYVLEDPNDRDSIVVEGGLGGSRDVVDGTVDVVVAVGCHFVLNLTSWDDSSVSVSQNGPGPEEPGETVRVELAPGVAPPVLVGRLVDEDGAPLAGRYVTAEPVEPGETSLPFFITHTEKTGRDGVFRVVLDQAPGNLEAPKIRISMSEGEVRGAGRRRDIAFLDAPAELVAGDNDLGTITVAADPFLVSGRIVRPDGSPAVGAAVHRMGASRLSRSRDRSAVAVKTGQDGTFALRGPLKNQRVLLGVDAAPWVVDADPNFFEGQRDVTIRLLRGGVLKGSLRLPEHLEPGDVVVAVSGPVVDNYDSARRSLRRGRELRVADDGSFEAGSLRTGDADLEVRLRGGAREVLWSIEGLAIVAGETNQDPRTQGIDLGGAGGRVRVTVTDHAGKPVEGAQIYTRSHGRPRGWSFIAAAGNSFPVGEDSLDVRVVAEGYRVVERFDVSEDVTIALERAAETRIELRLAEGVALPDPPLRLEVTIDWIGRLDSQVVEWNGRGGARNARADRPGSFGGAAFGVDRTLTFRAWEPGRYQVCFSVSKPEGPREGRSSRGIGRIPGPPQLTVTGDGKPLTVEVAPDAEAYEKLLSEGR